MCRTLAAARGVLTLAALAACGSSGETATGDAGTAVAIGAACIPSQELSTTFLGFDSRDVVLDEGNVACGSGVCLVNHYQGRVTCPYGQDEAADGPFGAAPGGSAKCGGASAPSACCTPGSDQSVLASQDVGSATPTHSQVQPGCVDRPSAKTVTCSCRCANAAGKTDDGAQYCSCPGGFACTQVVPELTVGDPLAGAYCIANGSAYDSLTSCTGGVECDPTQNDCSPPAAGTRASADAGAEATYFVTALQGYGGGTCHPLVLPTDASGKANVRRAGAARGRGVVLWDAGADRDGSGDRHVGGAGPAYDDAPDPVRGPAAGRSVRHGDAGGVVLRDRHERAAGMRIDDQLHDGHSAGGIVRHPRLLLSRGPSPTPKCGRFRRSRKAQPPRGATSPSRGATLSMS